MKNFYQAGGQAGAGSVTAKQLGAASTRDGKVESAIQGSDCSHREGLSKAAVCSHTNTQRERKELRTNRNCCWFCFHKYLVERAPFMGNSQSHRAANTLGRVGRKFRIIFSFLKKGGKVFSRDYVQLIKPKNANFLSNTVKSPNVLFLLLFFLEQHDFS